MARRRPAQRRRARRLAGARAPRCPPAERAEFDRVMAGELPEGWREVLHAYKRRAVDARRGAGRHHDLGRDQRSARPSAARTHGRLRRPRSADQPQARLQAFTAERPQRRLRALRRARAPDGRDGERHGRARRRHPARRHLPRVLRLRAPGDAHGRADGPAGEVRLQPRLDRRRQERADAPAGRDPGVAARDAQHAGAASGRCGRSRRVLGDRARASHAARRRWSSRARRCPRCGAAHAADNLSRRGAYVLAEAEGGARARHAARDRIGGRARARRRASVCRPKASPTAVVSMPCCERFDEQDAAYRAARARRGHGARRGGGRACASAGTAISASAAASSA